MFDKPLPEGAMQVDGDASWRALRPCLCHGSQHIDINLGVDRSCVARRVAQRDADLIKIRTFTQPCRSQRMPEHMRAGWQADEAAAG